MFNIGEKVVIKDINTVGVIENKDDKFYYIKYVNDYYEGSLKCTESNIQKIGYVDDEEKAKYDLIRDLSHKISNIKGYTSAYTNPGKGVMIVNKHGVNYIVEVTPINVDSIGNAIKDYGYLFK